MELGSASLTAARRVAELERLVAGEVVDVLVVGGGITGAGVALDAASRGLSVALVERHDLAHGTSRWSSKLAHNGLRYLAKGRVGLVWEATRERGLLFRNAPHLVRPLPWLFPLNDAIRPAAAAKIEVGIRIADRLRAAAGTSRSLFPSPRRISPEEALRMAPALDPHRLRGGLVAWDGKLEDDARLVVAVARTAAAHGARILTRCDALELRPGGATLRDTLTGERFEARARHIVNAAGLWAGELDSRIRLRPSRGTHALVPAAVLGDPVANVNVPVPGEAGRFVFAIPGGDGTVTVGVTDVPYEGEAPDEPVAPEADVAYLLETISRAFERPLRREDVLGAYAGFRPLLDPGKGAPTRDLSRRHSVVGEPGGVLTVVGGKLTTYRKMADDVVGRITRAPCRTERLPLVGSGPAPAGVPERLARRYGTEAGDVLGLGAGRPDLLEQAVPGLPTLRAELAFGVEHELALTAEDLVDRRTRLGLIAAERGRALAAAREILA